jgi:integrase
MDLEKFVAWRSSRTSRKTEDAITRKTINFDVFTLKMLFRRLVRARIIRDNPTETIKQLSEVLPPFHVITDKEEARFLFASPQPLRDIATIMIETGMRPGEFYDLRSCDVCLEKNYLQAVRGKTKASRRRVYLTDRTYKVLEYRLQKFDGEYLFPQNDIDGQQATSSICALHLETVRKLGFDFRLYDCRHTFASRALEKGTDLITLTSILGHANLKMVMRYAHPSEKHKEDAIRGIEKSKKKA